MKLLGKVTIGGASTPTRLTTTSPTLCSMVVIQAEENNTDDVYVGDSTVDELTSLGIKLGVPVANETPPSLVLQDPGGNNRIDLSQIWFDSTSAAQDVIVYYLQS